MTFAELLDHLGGMGRFQVLYVASLAVPLLMLANHNLLQNFTAGIPDHRCQVHLPANETRLANGNQEEVLRAFIPTDGQQKLDKCRRFVTVQWQLLEPNRTSANGTEVATEPCLDGWSYSKEVFPHTIVTEWDLVCESKTLKQMAQSVYMAGILVGSALLGSLSDKFGRKALLIWCYLQMAITGTCAAFAPSFTTYCLFRFLAGLAMSGISLNSISLCMEWIPTHIRAVVGTINGYCYTTGQFILAGIAFAIPDWRWLQLTVSLPFFIFFLYSWYGQFCLETTQAPGDPRPHSALKEPTSPDSQHALLSDPTSPPENPGIRAPRLPCSNPQPRLPSQSWREPRCPGSHCLCSNSLVPTSCPEQGANPGVRVPFL